VPLRFLSDAQREQLSGIPAELDSEALDRFFTLSSTDVAEVRRRHGDSNRLGWALQMCALRMLGFCPDGVTNAPAVAVRFLARQLDIDVGALDDYGRRLQTRTDHVKQAKAYLGFRSATPDDLERLGAWLAAEALEQDRPIVLFHLACTRLHELRLVRPGLTVIERSLVGTAREAARQETARRVAPLLTTKRCERLDGLLEVDAEIGRARATWLRHFPVAAAPSVMHDEMDKVVFLRELGVEGWDLGALPARRVAILARWVQAASNQALAQSSAERRYPALLAFGAERLVEIVDSLVDLFDKLLADTNAKARKRLADYRQSVAAAANDKVLLLAVIARVLLDPDLDDDSRLEAVFEAVPKDRLVAALVDCERIARPADDSHIDLLGDHYSRLRQCVPRLLEDAARGELRCVAGTRSVLESGESVTKEAETPAFDRRRMDANAACDLIRGVLALARQDDPCPSCSSLLGRCGAHPALELGTYAIGDRDGNRRSPSTSHAATRSPR
jgi:hypothetical protein